MLGFGDMTGKAESANTPLARAFVPGPSFGGETKRLIREIQKHLKANQNVVLVTRQAARLQEELGEAEIPVRLQSELAQRPAPGVTLVQGIAVDGFVLRVEATGSSADQPSPTTLHLLTDVELFGWRKAVARKARKPQSTVAPELFFADVKSGDYVVHMEHGIGQYEGLIRLLLGGVEREYLQVNYAQGDKLYVPVHQADRLSRYVGAGDGGVPPSITRLGTADWQLVKERAKKAVEDIAEDLLALYAEREVVKGYGYSPDGAWQEEMEAAFPFQETEDQLPRHRRREERHGSAAAHGSHHHRRCGLWQDRSCDPRRLQSRHRQPAGSRTGADHCAGAAALPHLQPALGALSRTRRNALALPHPSPTGASAQRSTRRQRGHCDRHASSTEPGCRI